MLEVRTGQNYVKLCCELNWISHISHFFKGFDLKQSLWVSLVCMKHTWTILWGDKSGGNSRPLSSWGAHFRVFGRRYRSDPVTHPEESCFPTVVMSELALKLKTPIQLDKQLKQNLLLILNNKTVYKYLHIGRGKKCNKIYLGVCNTQDWTFFRLYMCVCVCVYMCV